MTEITKACTVAFMKARNSLVVRCREKRANWKKTKKTSRNYENIFLKLLLIDFGEHRS